MNKETKYIIIKNSKGFLRHYKSNVLHHNQLARCKGYNSLDILEAGLYLEGKLYILDCIDNKHLLKHSWEYIGNRLDDILLKEFLKGRELESQLYYSKGILREGD